MDFFIEEKRLENRMLKVELQLVTEFYTSAFEIYEADASFMDVVKAIAEKAKIILAKAIRAIQDFIANAIMKVHIRVQQISVQTKLADIKNILAKKKSQLNHKKIDVIAIVRYKKYYSDFIKTYTKELITGLNKNFKSVEEYNKWKDATIAKLDEFSFMLSDEEKWRLTSTVSDAVHLSETEFNNRESIIKMIGEDGTGTIKTIEGYYQDAVHTSMFGDPKLSQAIFKLKNSFIGSVCSKIASCVRKAVSFFVSHLFKIIAAIAAAIIIF